MNRRNLIGLAAASSLAILGSSSAALAQPAGDWPSKAVRVLTPFPTGSGPEVVLRQVAYNA